jgi:ComF family protein
MDSAVARCPQCRAEEFEFDCARSFGLYSGKLRALILQLKFRRREPLGEKLGELLAPNWNSLVEAGPDLRSAIVPVPLHLARQRQRGFNQAELLARGLMRKLAQARDGTKSISSPCLETRCLHRTRATVSQPGLSLVQRRENVHGVFAVTRPERIRGRAVILVDDVMTTGATLSACAGALKKAGALRVAGLTLARATLHFPDPDVAEPAQAIDDFEHDWT